MKTTIISTKIVITLATLLLSCQNGKAQTNNLIPDTPPTPQAVAFNRLGDYLVNNNYGAPDINIPLFEIDHHGYKIPLALHYEASPMKPGYNYDVTGLGWTLSGNSCVSRTIKDRADEIGRFNNQFALDPFYLRTGQEMKYKDYIGELDKMNYQFDSYNIVLPSGRTIPFFMYKSGGTMQYSLMSSDGNVRISCSYSTYSIDAFTVTDENGIVYSFTLADKTSNGFENDVNADRNVTWLLTSIDIPAKGRISYEYNGLKDINAGTVSEPSIRVSRLTSEMGDPLSELGIHVSNIPQTQSPRYRMRFLKRISYGPTVINFNYQSDGRHMKEIVVSDNSDIIRKITLSINYSALTSLVISGQNDSDKLVYGFTYSNNYFGYSTNKVYTDFWGNCILTNTNRNTDTGNFNMYFDYIGIDLPTVRNELHGNGDLACVIDTKPDDLNYYNKLKLQSAATGDTRQPASPQQHGVLTSITYPNGGQTSFNWENHRLLTASAADGDMVFDRRSQRIIEGGGFRIESIINWNADGEIVSKDYYRYGYTYKDIAQQNFPLPLPNNYNPNEHIGCGEPVVDPNVLTFMSYTHATGITAPLEFQKMIIGLPSAFKIINDIRGRATWWDAYFSANTFRALLGGRRPVVYPEVTVYHGHPYETSECKGKTVYRFDIYSDQLSSANYYLATLRQTNYAETGYFEPLYYFCGAGLRCMEDPSKRHQLTSKSEYSFVGNKWELVSEETYTYNHESLSKTGYMFDSNISRGHCGTHTFAMGATKPVNDYSLAEFYNPNTQKLGKATMDQKNTTILRQGGTRTYGNTLSEQYFYIYSGVLKNRNYTDVYDNEELYSYVGEQNGSTSDVIADMKSRNMLASVITAKTFPTDWPSRIISGSKIDYGFYGNDILPKKLYEWNGDNYEASIEVISYDSYGNPTEIVDLKTGNKENGIHSVFVWDTYGRYLIALIKNAELSQVQGVTSQLSSGTSQSRYNALKSLLPNAQIQTWAYKPLIGVSSHTDINGQTLLYEYDGLGRLKTVKRVVNGCTTPEIINEYEYNYKNTSL